MKRAYLSRIREGNSVIRITISGSDTDREATEIMEQLHDFLTKENRRRRHRGGSSLAYAIKLL